MVTTSLSILPNRPQPSSNPMMLNKSISSSVSAARLGAEPRRSSDRDRDRERERGIGGVPYDEQGGGSRMVYGDEDYARSDRRYSRGGPDDRYRAGEPRSNQDYNYQANGLNPGSSLPNPYGPSSSMTRPPSQLQSQSQPRPQSQSQYRAPSPSSLSSQFQTGNRYPLTSAMPSASATSSTFGGAGQSGYGANVTSADGRGNEDGAGSGPGYGQASNGGLGPGHGNGTEYGWTSSQPGKTETNRYSERSNPNSYQGPRLGANTSPIPNPYSDDPPSSTNFNNEPNHLSGDPTTSGSGSGIGRVTLPLLHLGSFSSLKLEDFAMPLPPSGTSPSPSPLSATGPRSPGNGPRSGYQAGYGAPGGDVKEFDAQKDDEGNGMVSLRLRPKVGTEDMYRSTSPSGAGNRGSARSLSPNNGKEPNGNDRLSPINLSFSDGPSLEAARPTLVDRQSSGDAMTPGMAGVGSNGMFADRLDEDRGGLGDAVAGGVQRDQRQGPYAPKEGRPGSGGSIGTGSAAVRRMSGQSVKRTRDPSPLGRSRNNNISGQTSPPPEVAEDTSVLPSDIVDAYDDGDRDDHRQAFIRESTVNRRRTIIQEPGQARTGTDFMGLGAGDSPDSRRGKSYHEVQQGARPVPSGMRSRQASGNILELGEDDARGKRSPTRAANEQDLASSVDSPSRQQQPVLQPAFDLQQSQLPYQRLDAAMPSSESRFKDAEATPTKKRALPILPDPAQSRSRQASPPRDDQRERDRRIPSSSSWQQQNVQPSRTAAGNSSSRKVSPMGAVNLSQPPRPSSYIEQLSPRLEAIPGLMGEDGPYPSIARPQVRARPAVQHAIDRTSQYQEISIGRRPSAEVGRASGGAPPRVKVPPQAEEICLECMMRDRDLIHVDVTTEGVWERESDLDFRDMSEQERELAQQHQSESPEELDRVIVDEVGWRGFVWEDGEDGWGLPAGFRGHLAGRLLEDRLKDLLSKFPPAASFRMQTLQRYLQDQSTLFGQDPPEFVPDEEYSRLPTGQGTMGPKPKPSSPTRTQQTRERVNSTRSGQVEREIRGQVPRAGALTMYGAPEIGHESPYPEEELKRYQSQPDMLALQAYPGPNQRREMALRAEQGSRAVTMYVQSPGTSAAPTRQPSQQEYRPPPSGLTTAAQLEARKGRGLSSPGLMQEFPQGGSLYDRQSAASAYANQHRQEFERGEHQNNIPNKQFPFAVWAGRNGEMGAYSAQSSPGPRMDHSVNSHARPGGGMFGRFGGSVTSFFGGSQGGVSGSMMDMHLGLDNDRAYPRSPDRQTRSVSMASPAKPRFFARPSRESLQGNAARPTLLSRIRSSSSVMDLASLNRSSMHDNDNDGEVEDGIADDSKKKKKGIKGFLQKLGKGNKRKSSGSDASGVPARGLPAREEDATLPLRPPPSLSFLVDSRVDRPVTSQHGRSPSGSSLSGMVAAANNVNLPAGNAGVGQEDLSPPSEHRAPWTPQQQRSVSAPGIVNSASRTSLLSSSPTSSRYPYGQEGRAGQPTGYGPAAGQRDSISSTFSGRRRGSGVPVHGIDEERVHDSAVEVLEHENPRGWTEQPGPPPLQRHYREKAPSSSSSGTILPASLESPGPIGNAAYGHQVAVAGSGSSYSLSNQAGQPDRQKSLPPLPPGMRRDRPSPDGSPNSFDAFFGQPERYTTAPNMQQAPVSGYHGRQASAGQQSYQSAGQQSYISSGQSSINFARNQGQAQVQPGREADSDRQAKRTKSRFGLKGLFAGGLNLNKEDKSMANDRQYDRSPSLDAGGWTDTAGSRDDQPQRRVGGNAGNERYRQTYYQ